MSPIFCYNVDYSKGGPGLCFAMLENLMIYPVIDSWNNFNASFINGPYTQCTCPPTRDNDGRGNCNSYNLLSELVYFKEDIFFNFNRTFAFGLKMRHFYFSNPVNFDLNITSHIYQAAMVTDQLSYQLPLSDAVFNEYSLLFESLFSELCLGKDCQILVIESYSISR